MHQGFYRERDGSVDAFAALLATASTSAVRPASASGTQKGIPLYDCRDLLPMLDAPDRRDALLAELAQVLRQGAGVFVMQRAFPDTAPVDAASAIFDDIIASERRAGSSGADHFAQAGANDRIWNALEKLCLRAPGVFARYYANPMIALASEAWLGPRYQVTSQVNVVRPGGAAQKAHRDYHLGFLTSNEAARYPAHVHAMSPFLTLQGAVAHSAMPIDSGPTQLLPFSQQYAEGYVAWRRADFRAYFEAHFVQLPLEKGDALFFNPALFHAAGSNRTNDVQRMANLLQISSAYGRAMESVDRTAMCRAVFPVLRTLLANHDLSETDARSVMAACAEGYPFPTNLDRDPPIGGLAPPSQQDVLATALKEAWTDDRFNQALADLARRRLTD